jgi:molybdopterin synthase catalytic subunit
MDYCILTEISLTPLDICRGISFVSDDGHGAVASFIGVVRNHHQGKSVTGITYDAHETLAANTLHLICQEATGLWPGTKYYAAHYKGYLPVGGASVLIVVSSAHRADSFDGLRYIIEEIKLRLPIWKQEHYPGGHSEWLPGHSLKEEDCPASLPYGQCA